MRTLQQRFHDTRTVQRVQMNKDEKGIPIYDGQELTSENLRLNVLFDEMKKNQLTFLDEAGKRVIELSTGLLGVLFAVTAFGKDFPPAYLKGNPVVQTLVVLTLLAFVFAVLAGVFTVQPRSYAFYESNLTEMRKELEKIVAHKSFWMTLATRIFFTGTALLAALIAVLVLKS